MYGLVAPESAARATGDDKLKREPRRLFDPATNLRAGQDYLTFLMERSTDYDILRTVAAYNGGPGAVSRAVERCSASDPLLLIECLPAEETRDYVSRDLLMKILADTEEHIDFLENQHKLIELMGAQNYLQSAMKEIVTDNSATGG